LAIDDQKTALLRANNNRLPFGVGEREGVAERASERQTFLPNQFAHHKQQHNNKPNILTIENGNKHSKLSCLFFLTNSVSRCSLKLQ